MWILRHAFAIAILPVTVTVVVPIWLSGRNSTNVRPPADSVEWCSIALGSLLVIAGFVLFVTTIFLFATRGRGTLAPWDPPARLVVAGPYRFVRNPMIAGVLLILAGEALVLRSPAIGTWAAVFLLINAVYFPLVEEPQLESRFGEDYRKYKRHVPRPGARGGGLGEKKNEAPFGAPPRLPRLGGSSLGEITNTETIASGRGIHILDRLVRLYGKGNWLKRKGLASVRIEDGTIADAELHWFEAHGIGKRKMKIKRLLNMK